MKHYDNETIMTALRLACACQACKYQDECSLEDEERESCVTTNMDIYLRTAERLGNWDNFVKFCLAENQKKLGGGTCEEDKELI